MRVGNDAHDTRRMHRTRQDEAARRLSTHLFRATRFRHCTSRIAQNCARRTAASPTVREAVRTGLQTRRRMTMHRLHAVGNGTRACATCLRSCPERMPEARIKGWLFAPRSGDASARQTMNAAAANARERSCPRTANCIDTARLPAVGWQGIARHRHLPVACRGIVIACATSAARQARPTGRTARASRVTHPVRRAADGQRQPSRHRVQRGSRRCRRRKERRQRTRRAPGLRSRRGRQDRYRFHERGAESFAPRPGACAPVRRGRQRPVSCRLLRAVRRSRRDRASR